MSLSDTLTPTDYRQMQARGITQENVQQQLHWFRQGFAFLRLHRPCTVGDGITVLSPHQLDELTPLHDQASRAGRIMKFVPASGAASRMFQSLLTLAGRADWTAKDIADGAESGDRDCQQFRQLLARIDQCAFADDLRRVMARDDLSLDALLAVGHYQEFFTYVLTPKGLNYVNLPKGMIPFHRYSDQARTAFEEHLMEALAYTQDHTHTARVHFTVPVEQQGAIASYLQNVLPRYERAGGRVEITFSVQKLSTDTIAVDHDNAPFRDLNGELVFRPGGHGALLENLQDLQGDIIFIKNIDNVVPDHLKADTYLYKKALGGHLVSLQNALFTHIQRLRQKSVERHALEDAFTFAQQELHLQAPPSLLQASAEAQRIFLLQKLHRPLRVCGVVKNTGEPGGGPFWVQQADGALSLQIVESSQVDLHSAEQRAIWQSATHFNPVDLVCGVRDFAGKPFDLSRCCDPNTGFISSKSKDGKELRALELPGLWNGAMAEWNTVFVEVPLSTFNPVKTVYDLLRPEHQNA